jgi:hypothetical protein
MAKGVNISVPASPVTGSYLLGLGGLAMEASPVTRSYLLALGGLAMEAVQN